MDAYFRTPLPGYLLLTRHLDVSTRGLQATNLVTNHQPCPSGSGTPADHFVTACMAVDAEARRHVWCG